MKFRLEDITVFFPYEYIYPEQYRYMLELKRALDARGHCLLEVSPWTRRARNFMIYNHSQYHSRSEIACAAL